MLIHGINVLLVQRIPNGSNALGEPIFEELQPEMVENVLVAPIEGADQTAHNDSLRKRVSYQMAIPKVDNHVWENGRVSFFGKTFEVVGVPVGGIEELIPLEWNKKVTVREVV